MDYESQKTAHDLARQMLIDGEEFNTIMSKTNLDFDDIKQIKHQEIVNLLRY